jgi:hypothetical protein
MSLQEKELVIIGALRKEVSSGLKQDEATLTMRTQALSSKERLTPLQGGSMRARAGDYMLHQRLQRGDKKFETNLDIDDPSV